MIHMLVGREHHLRVADCARRDWHREAPPVPAIARHLAERVRCYALFATHYFELTRLAHEYSELANVHLDAGVEQEACPHNLAPTASTTAALALGDALAVALLDARGFGPDDFARSHPGGSLGRRLLTHVSDVMRSGDAVPTVGPQAGVSEAILAMSRGGLGLVCDLRVANREARYGANFARLGIHSGMAISSSSLARPRRLTASLTAFLKRITNSSRNGVTPTAISAFVFGSSAVLG